MTEVVFSALVKEVKVKALVSLDKGYEVKLQGESHEIAKLADAPADGTVEVRIKWNETS